MARSSSEAPVPRQTLPTEPGLQAQAQRFVEKHERLVSEQIIHSSSPFMGRFAAPPGALQGSFLRLSQGAGSGLVVEHGVSVQMKRPGEFPGIRPATPSGGHVMPGQQWGQGTVVSED